MNTLKLKLQYLKDELKTIYLNLQEISHVVTITKTAFNLQEDPIITVISKNRVYKVTLPDGTDYKARFIFTDNEKTHNLLIQNGVLIPKIIKIVPIDKSLSLKFMEWKKGTIYFNTLNSRNAYKDIPDIHYAELGKLLATIHNIPAGDGYLTMSDIYWCNFLVNGNKIWLLDSFKVNADIFPERYLINQVIAHEYTLDRQKLALLEGYLTTVRRTKFDKCYQHIITLLKNLTAEPCNA